MNDLPYNDKVVRCTSIEMQHATLGQFNTTNNATRDATESLKTLSNLILKRNKERNQSATNTEKPCNFYPEKATEKLHGGAVFSNTKTDKNLTINCGKCLIFKSHNDNGNGAGFCLAGVQSSGSCWWSDSLHQCAKFDAAVKWVELPDPKPDSLIVTCYTPNGDAIEVEARDQEHGEWLKRMNPKRKLK
jgi:hypothetical protein